MRWTFRPKPLDYLVFLLSAALVTALAAAVYSGRDGGDAVRITGPGGTWIYPLSERRTVRVEGPLGVTIIHIEEGAVRVIESPCPQKLCIRRGDISGPGHWNACLPNQVFLEIQAKGEEQPDAHTH